MLMPDVQTTMVLLFVYAILGIQEMASIVLILTNAYPARVTIAQVVPTLQVPLAVNARLDILEMALTVLILMNVR